MKKKRKDMTDVDVYVERCNDFLDKISSYNDGQPHDFFVENVDEKEQLVICEQLIADTLPELPNNDAIWQQEINLAHYYYLLYCKNERKKYLNEY